MYRLGTMEDQLDLPLRRLVVHRPRRSQTERLPETKKRADPPSRESEPEQRRPITRTSGPRPHQPSKKVGINDKSSKHNHQLPNNKKPRDLDHARQSTALNFSQALTHWLKQATPWRIRSLPLANTTAISRELHVISAKAPPGGSGRFLGGGSYGSDPRDRRRSRGPFGSVAVTAGSFVDLDQTGV